MNPNATAGCNGLEGDPACARRGYCRTPGVDEDCDGQTNEGCPTAACDADADGYAAASCCTAVARESSQRQLWS